MIGLAMDAAARVVALAYWGHSRAKRKAWAARQAAHRSVERFLGRADYCIYCERFGHSGSDCKEIPF